VAGITDLEEFEKLFNQTSKMIYSLGLRLFKNDEDALDFSQDVYLQAYNKLHLFAGKSKFSTWLYSLALNLGLNKLNKDKRLKISYSENQDTLDYLVEQTAGDLNEDPFAQISQKEFENLIMDSLNKLPESYRLPIILFYYDKVSYEDIAASLGIKVGTLKSNIHRGKLLLRDTLIKAGIEYT